MDIVIDTNILRADLKLRSQDYEFIFDYLRKTNSKIVLPKIVLEETLGLYERSVREKLETYKRSLSKLNETLAQAKLPLREVSIETEIEAYEELLFTKLGIARESVVAYKNENLEDLVKRAIYRKKPLGENGQQFRDGILWLTLLDIAQSSPEKRIILISKNSKDFCDKGTNQLAAELMQEAKEKGVEIFFFKDLSEFSKDHAVKVNFITEDWLRSNVNLSIIEDIFNKIIKHEEDHIKEQHEGNLDIGEFSTGDFNENNYINSRIKSFYANELSDGRILINIEFEIEKEYTLDIIREVEEEKGEYVYRSFFDSETGDIEYEPIYIPKFYQSTEHDLKPVYPLFLSNFIVTVKDRKIVDYEYKDWDWG